MNTDNNVSSLPVSSFTDKFSWRRCLAVGSMYGTTPRNYLLLSAGLTVICYLLVQLLAVYGNYALSWNVLLSSIPTLCLYMGSAVFARRDDTLMGQLPVTAGEKFVYYILYALVAVPVASQGVWCLLNEIFTLINPELDYTVIQSRELDVDLSIFTGQTRLAGAFVGCVQTSAAIITALFAVLSAKNHRILYAFCGVFGVILACALIAGLAGFLFGFMGVKDEIADEIRHADPESIKAISLTATKAMLPYINASYILVLGYIVFIGRKIYRLLASRQIAN